MVTATDVGLAINPRGCVKQLQGAMLEAALPHALYEELIIDQATGKALNSNWLDLKKPYPLDVPQTDGIVLETGTKEDSAWGVKGIGNAGCLAIMPAIANAACNALGVDFMETPLTPDRVLRALGKV
jgi:xanthine dehydrogenase molybdenum-binding subunit